MKERRYFQWLDGELFGTASVLDYIEEEDGEYYYHFTDGEVCNVEYIAKMTKNFKDLYNKMLVEVDSPSDLWRMEEIKSKLWTSKDTGETIEIPTLEDVLAAGGSSDTTIKNSTLGKFKLVPPTREPYRWRELPDPSDYAPVKKAMPDPVVPEPVVSVPVAPVQEIVDTVPMTFSVPPVVEQSAVTVQTARVVAPDPIVDPVAILVKNCKKHSTEVDLTLTMDLPARSTFDFASSEFEGGAEKFIECVLKDLSSDMIFDALKQALLVAYFQTEDK